MPVEMQTTRRRYFSIQEGRMRERIDETTTREYNHVSGHIIAIGFRTIEKEENGTKKAIGTTIQIHILDEKEYFVVETWNNSAYAKAFYQVMERIDYNKPVTIITDQKTKDGKKKPALFVRQSGAILKWSYTKDDMKDCPPIVAVDDGGKWLVDDKEQQQYFLAKVNNWLIPHLNTIPNPYPNHPFFGESTEPTASTYEPIETSSDDLPF